MPYPPGPLPSVYPISNAANPLIEEKVNGAGHKAPSGSHRDDFKTLFSTPYFWQATNPGKARRMTSTATDPKASPGSIAPSEMADEAALPSPT